MLEEVELTAVEERGGHVGRVPVPGPEQGVGAVEVAAGPAQVDDLDHVAVAFAAGQVEDPRVVDRRRDHVQAEAGEAPQHLAVADVVGAGAPVGGDDDLHPTLVLVDRGRRPGGRLSRPFPAPQLLAGALVERDHEGVPFVVPVDHQGVAVQRRRAPLAVAEARRHVAEVDLPDQLALERVGIGAAGPEVSVDALAVRDRRSVGPGRLEMVALVGDALVGHPLPVDGSVPSIVGRDQEAVALELDTGRRLLRRRGFRGGRLAVRGAGPAHGLGREHEDPLAPHDRRGEAVPVDRDLEADVLPLAPPDRRVAVGADSVAERSSPLRPAGRGLGVHRGRGERREAGKDERGSAEAPNPCQRQPCRWRPSSTGRPASRPS